MAELARGQHSNRGELERQEKRKKELQDQQVKLIEMRYADAIPLDKPKSEQERISRELAGAQQLIERCSTEIDAVLKVVEEALLLCANTHRLYLSATPDVRRQLNQAVFNRFWIIDDQVHGADLNETFAQLLAPDQADEVAVVEDTDATAATASGGRTEGTKRARQASRRPTRAHSAHLAVARPTEAIQRPNGPTTGRNEEPRPLPGPGFEHPYSGGRR